MQFSVRFLFCIAYLVFQCQCAPLTSGDAVAQYDVQSVASKHGVASTFMLVSGITASQDMCLTAENGNVDLDGAAVTLESCAAALATGDGRELWSLQPNGQMLNVAGKKCVGLQGEAAEGGNVILMDCDAAMKSGEGRSQWEVLGNGQLKIGLPGQFCLSQSGVAPGTENVAAKAAAVASSTADAAAHGAKMAVDDNEASFWASKLDDTKDPVTFTIDLGGPHKLQYAQLSWEFPAKSFAVSLSADGEHFREIFSTDVNVLTTTYVPLDSTPATQVKIVMREPHAVYGRFQDHAIYGIKSIALYAPRLQAIVGNCANAAKSTDARDKYFLSYVGEFDPSPAKSLQSELPLLEAAKISLTTTISDLAGVLPRLASCQAPGRSMKQHMVSTGNPVPARNTSILLRTRSGPESAIARTTAMVDALMAEARSTILAVHKVLN